MELGFIAITLSVGEDTDRFKVVVVVEGEVLFSERKAPNESVGTNKRADSKTSITMIERFNPKERTCSGWAKSLKFFFIISFQQAADLFATAVFPAIANPMPQILISENAAEQMWKNGQQLGKLPRWLQRLYLILSGVIIDKCADKSFAGFETAVAKICPPAGHGNSLKIPMQNL